MKEAGKISTLSKFNILADKLIYCVFVSSVCDCGKKLDIWLWKRWKSQAWALLRLHSHITYALIIQLVPLSIYFVILEYSPFNCSCLQKYPFWHNLNKMQSKIGIGIASHTRSVNPQRPYLLNHMKNNFHKQKQVSIRSTVHSLLILNTDKWGH